MASLTADERCLQASYILTNRISREKGTRRWGAYETRSADPRSARSMVVMTLSHFVQLRRRQMVLLRFCDRELAT